MEKQLYLDGGFNRSRKHTILLITNRDSDNVGDQVIEACDIALVKTVMGNLGFNDEEYKINSKALSIISNKYCENEDPRSLKSAYKAIEECSLILFGGAPVFNYYYKNFYKKTATLLKIAKDLSKPVLFSAIGINDAFNENDSRCQLLKGALHNGSVLQITARDGIEHLKAYAAEKGNSQCLPIDLVSDPAVYAKQVFGNLVKKEFSDNKKIGLFVFRAGGFVDNGIPFSRTQQAALWCDLCRRLKKKGYDYELLTSGHFADEAFLKYLIDEGFVQREKCIQSVDTPEELVSYINSYDAVVTARLHPSIISFSCEVPAVGLIWNSKVEDFYNQIGYPSRAIFVNRLFKNNYVSSEALLDELENAMQEGVCQDKGYLWSVYRTLYSGFMEIFESKGRPIPYSEEEVESRISKYPGTSAEERDEKISRKLARCYRKYNDIQIKHGSADSEISLVFYHSGGYPAEADADIFQGVSSEVIELPSGNLEYRYCEAMNNNGKGVFAHCGFFRKGKTFLGWRLRFRVGREWFWYSRRGKALPKGNKGSARRAKIFEPEQKMPLLPYKHIDSLVIEAVWK
jgi:polysaccharide pyruvyl transferase WcaK-like protein